jgi:predicted nucleotidyltransferase
MPARIADFDELMARARADPGVVGVVLTGSHARGLATEHSDIDVGVIIGETGASSWQRRRTREIDQFVCTVDELADTSVGWQRYAYRGCRVLLDERDGLVQRLADRQARPTPDEARTWARDGLDGYVNFLYRAAKSRRDGEHVAAALDTAESVSWLLTTVFALHGRLRPYNKYLRWELDTYPLGEPWTALPERVAEDPAGLFADVERLAREQGLADVLDEWGDDLELVRGAGQGM